MRKTALTAVLALVMAGVAGAQSPAGPAFQVNSYTPNEQKFGHPAVGPRGNFLIVWNSLDQDGSGFGVFARSYDALGNPHGGEFRVNAQAAGNQYMSGVSVDAGGNYVVVWTNDVGNPDPSRDIFARVLDPFGTPLTGDVRVNAFVAGRQSAPAVAPLPGGGFVVVWESNYQDGSSFAVVGRRFDSRGNPLGGDFLVNTFTPGSQSAPRVASDARGQFGVVWHSPNQDGSALGIFGRRFDANGTPLSGEFQVNQHAASYQRYPVISTIADGRFIVAWEDFILDGNRYGVFGRAYDAAGSPTGNQFQMNVYTVDHQHYPSVVNYGDNSFMAAWYSQDQFGFLNQDVLARQYRGGVPGPEILINPSTAGNQFQGELDADEVGNVVAVWNSVGQDGSLDGVYARRFGGLIPVALGVDNAGAPSNANRVFEIGETVYVQPWWFNASGSTLAFDGAGAFTGPPGATYTMVDGAASYGAVANGTSGPCVDGPSCYRLSVNAAVRPAAHWDAQFREGILPASQGQSKVWSLHIGDTFADVPRSNPFYRFVETALHAGVMSGCTPNQFCRTSMVRRDEMATHVMQSKAPHYLPPACVPGLEAFNDLPASNPHCRFVEELVRRGVVAGCGGGSYCPSQPVNRETLAVYLLKTADPALVPPPCVTPVFNDVPVSSTFCPWIHELHRRGVVGGCGGGRYCPSYLVDREQMSVFLTVTFGLNLYGP